MRRWDSWLCASARWIDSNAEVGPSASTPSPVAPERSASTAPSLAAQPPLPWRRRLVRCATLSLLATPLACPLSGPVGELLRQPSDSMVPVAWLGMAFLLWWVVPVTRDAWAAPRYWPLAAVFALVIGGWAVVRLYVGTFSGFPALAGGDAGHHVTYMQQLAAGEVSQYHAVGFHATAHWVRRAFGVDDLDAFALVFYTVVACLCCFVALVTSYANRRTGRAWLGQYAVALVLWLATAESVVLPLLHYYQCDGFLPHLFGLLPMMITATGYAVATRRSVRLLCLAAGLAGTPVFYALHLGDLLVVAAVLLGIESRASVRAVSRLLRGTIVVLVAVAVWAYATLWPLGSMAGGLRRLELLPVLLAVGTLSAFLLLASSDRLFHVRSPVNRRLYLFVGVFGVVAVAAASASGWPFSMYYVQKYTFIPAVLVSLTAVVCLVDCMASCWRSGESRRAAATAKRRVAAVANVLAAATAMALLAWAVTPYRQTYRERVNDAGPWPRINRHADPGVLDLVRYELEARRCRFGGLIVPGWSETTFANATLGLGYLDLEARFTALRDRCHFWYASVRTDAAHRPFLSWLRRHPKKRCVPIRFADGKPARDQLCYLKSAVTRVPIPLVDYKSRVSVEGLHNVERTKDGRMFRWTNGRGRINIAAWHFAPLRGERDCVLQMVIERQRPARVTWNGEALVRAGKGWPLSSAAFEGRQPISIAIESTTFVPAQTEGTTDRRVLGVPIFDLAVACGLGAD